MSLLASWLASPPPDAAVEIAPDRVAAASTALLAGRGSTAQAFAVEPLPPGVVVPSLTGQNIADRAAVASALRAVLGRLGARPRRVSLIVPDLVAKVSLVRFDRVPARRDDLDQLVRWHLRKSAPFPVEEASVTYTPGVRLPEGGSEFVVAVARREIVQEYEAACGDAGAYAGIVDLATLSVLNLLLASSWVPAADWLVVHLRPEYTSIAIMRGEDMIFCRNRPEGDEATLADMVHQTAMYYQDRLAGQGFARVLLGGSGRVAGALDVARQSLEERLETAVEPIDPIGIAGLSERAGTAAELPDVLAPLVGMLLRANVERGGRRARGGARAAHA